MKKSKNDVIKQFEKNVCQLVLNEDLTFLDAVFHQANVLGIDSSIIPKFISPQLKMFIRQEAIERNLIKPSKKHKAGGYACK